LLIEARDKRDWRAILANKISSNNYTRINTYIDRGSR